MPEQLTNPSISVEYCECCRSETKHTVYIDILEESSEGPHVSSSREPYRVTVCEQCDTETEVRMNDK